MVIAREPRSPTLIEQVCGLLPRLRQRAPKVHCITNTVAQPITANVLLAAGATPSLTTSEDEIAAFTASADAVLVNLGTLDAERRRAIHIALDAADSRKIPWLLDPVFVERSVLRFGYARELLARKPSAIRLNTAEFTALTGEPATAGAVQSFAKSCGAIVALTGAVDVVSDGARVASIGNGDPLMGKITAMGCAGSAFATAALAVQPDAFIAVACALTVFGVAGECAAAISKGPGTLAFAIIDTLHTLAPETVSRHARMSVRLPEPEAGDWS